MDELDRAIVNALQAGIAPEPRPFRAAAGSLGTDEATLIARLQGLLERGVLTRFGPLWNADRLGGQFVLCALSVPEAEFERVCAIVNGYPEVAHNYERAHRWNMWFVLAAADPARARAVLAEIGARTGCPVLELPKLEEYFVELRLAA